MNVTGIIAEYNPFHSGHQYHLQKTKQLTGADYLIAVISGNFVQRGEPAVFDKSIRTHMALLCGADLVLELPAPFACGSAEDFAMGAVSLLHKLGVITHLSFGSEYGSLEPLYSAAKIILQEPPIYRETLKQSLRQGASYPQARTAALHAAGLDNEKAMVIEQPNNLLGLEYLKALFRLNSPIRPITVPRNGSPYHDKTMENGKYASATAMRQIIARYFPGRSINQLPDSSPLLSGHTIHKTALPPDFFLQIPPALAPFYREKPCFPLFPDDCSALLNYQILLSLPQNQLIEFSDMSPELANRLKKQGLETLSFTNRINALKTRQYTYTRISRTLLHVMLTIRREEMEAYRETGYSSYARILGFKKEAAPLLGLIKQNSTIPLISKAADAFSYLSQEGRRLWEKDIFCSQVYSTLLQQKYGISAPDEFRRQIIILSAL